MYLAPFPPSDRTRRASVVYATIRDSDDASVSTTKFELSLVAAEYEYGVPLETLKPLWLHKLTIPEQSFNHPKFGEITVSGSLDDLFMTCNS